MSNNNIDDILKQYITIVQKFKNSIKSEQKSLLEVSNFLSDKNCVSIVELTQLVHNVVINTPKLDNLIELDLIRNLYLGKNGLIPLLLRTVQFLNNEEKKITGKFINEIKVSAQDIIDSQVQLIKINDINNKVNNESIDLSINTLQPIQGGLHPITAVISQLVAIFGVLGYRIHYAPEVDTDWHNFTALNVPLHHPARQNHDTFYVNAYDDNMKKVLRTHTSNNQIRAIKEMINSKGELIHPVKIIAPGKAYRNDSDSTHSPMFHQIELLYVDKKENIDIPSLKSLLLYFVHKFFENDNLQLRFRPSYFPFTSPSYEVDIKYNKKDNYLILGEGDSWLEILGCGIVHNKILENCGLDSSKYSGYAFGAGIERLAMLKYNFKDLRAFFEGDTRWLDYYKFNYLHTSTIFGGL